MLKFINTQTQKFSAKLMVGAMLGTGLFSPEAFATGNGFQDYSKNVTTEFSSVPNIINFVCYTGGAGLAGLGLFGVKKHVDEPSQMALKKPLAQCLVGGGLLAFPTLANMMVNTADGGVSGNNSFSGSAFGTPSL